MNQGTHVVNAECTPFLLLFLIMNRNANYTSVSRFTYITPLINQVKCPTKGHCTQAVDYSILHIDVSRVPWLLVSAGAPEDCALCPFFWSFLTVSWYPCVSQYPEELVSPHWSLLFSLSDIVCRSDLGSASITVLRSRSSQLARCLLDVLPC